MVGGRAQGRHWLATPFGAWLDRAMRRRGLRHDRELLDVAVVCREAIGTVCDGAGTVATVRAVVDGLERRRVLTRAEKADLATALCAAAPSTHSKD